MMLELHWGCQEENLILDSILLESGLDVNDKDKQGRTSLHIASVKGDKLFDELLFQRGATDTSAVPSRGEISLDCGRDEAGMTPSLVQMMAREGKAQLAHERLQLSTLSEKGQQRMSQELDIKSSKRRTSPVSSQLFGNHPIVDPLGLKDPESRLSSLSNVSECSRLSIAESGYSELAKTPDNGSMESVQSNASTSSGFASVDEITPRLNRRATTALTRQEFKALNRSSFMPRSRAVSEPASRPVQRAMTWTLSNRNKMMFSCSKTTATKKTLKKCVTFPSNVLLENAVKNDDFVETCHLIKSRKVDFNQIGCNGLTPLHVAAIEGSYECLQLLVDLGANVRAQDDNGWTPLHDAVFHGHVSCALALIKAGADISAETNDFRTIIDMTEDDHMVCVVGRAMACKFGQEDGDESAYHEQVLYEPTFDPDRETCV